MLLLFTLLTAAAVVGLVLAPRRDWPRWIDNALVVALAFLPLAFAATVLVGSLGELGVLRIEPVGKRLVFGPGLPVTVGGSSADSEAFEDLHSRALASLPPAVVQLEEREEEGLRLALDSPSPIVRVTDLDAAAEGAAETRVLNALPLVDQDQIVLAGGGEPYLKLVFQDRALGAPRLILLGDAVGEDDRAVRLEADPGLVYLPDVLAEMGVETAAGERYVSALERVDGDWRLLLREDTVELKSADGETRRFVRDHPVADDIRLELQVVWTANNERILRTVRSDRLRVGDGEVEVRYGETQLLAAELPREADGRGRLALAVVVPEISEERATVELPDASARFRGLSALLEVDGDGEATISHLGQTEPLEFGRVYGLGEGLGGGDGANDRLLVRIDRETFPWVLLVDLTLLGLYFLVFLGRMMRIDGALAALVGSVGLLLACRLLFAYRAAARPPDFAVGVLTEARVALWVVPGLLVGFYAFAWLVARFSTRPGDRLVRRYRVAWPLGGVAVAILGLRMVGGGWGLVMPLLAVGLVVAFLAMAPGRRAWARRVERLQRRGMPWHWWTPLAAGVAILLLRFVFDLLGMPETLRLPGGGRILWTVLQIPVAVAVVALSLHHLDQLWRTPGRDAARQLLLGVLALLGFLATAFLAVALLVDDTGLVIAQSLPYVLAVVCLLGVPALWRSRRGAPPEDGPEATAGLGLRLAAAALLVLPAVGVLWMNLLPEQAMAVGTTLSGQGGDGAASFDQRLYRLYMLSDPDLLRDFGLVASERMAVHYETLQDYARLGGWTGAGYLATDLPRYLGATYLSDLVPMVFVLPEMGRLGLLGLVLLYLVPLLGLAFFAAPAAGPSTGRGPLVRQALWLSLVALLAFAVPSLFMVLGNLNMALFTGKNLSLLGVNSLSDVLEVGLVLGLAVTGLVLRMMPEVPEPGGNHPVEGSP